MKHIIKDSLEIQQYSKRKLLKSIEKVLISEGYSIASAQRNSSFVAEQLDLWLKNKTQVTSNEIRKQVAKTIEQFDKNASLLYIKHKQIW